MSRYYETHYVILDFEEVVAIHITGFGSDFRYYHILFKNGGSLSSVKGQGLITKYKEYLQQKTENKK